MERSGRRQRTAFDHWIRTGRLPPVRTADGVELKFNPWHDPTNGQFTFAPGGPRSLARMVISDRYGRRSIWSSADRTGSDVAAAAEASAADPETAADGTAPVELASLSRPPRASRGSNSRAFEDPMTLEQVFPGLRGAPGGTILAVADNLLDLRGPAEAASSAVLDNHIRGLFAEIATIDPSWRYQTLGPATTVQGRINRLNDLRFQRAATILRVRGDARPLQVEVLRFVQERADRAYDEGVKLLQAGLLKTRLSDREALGNHIDRRVRVELRMRLNQLGIDSAGKGPVRVNRRENIGSGSELTYRRPDSRVNDVAFDVTLAEKTLGTAQIRGFFAAEFRPNSVVIIRPRQIGGRHSYIISRPEPKR